MPSAIPLTDTVCADDTASPSLIRIFAYNKGRQAAFGYKQSDILHGRRAVSRHPDRQKARYKVCWIARRQDGGIRGTPEVPALTGPISLRQHEGFATRPGALTAVTAAMAEVWTPLATGNSLWPSTAEPLRALRRSGSSGHVVIIGAAIPGSRRASCRQERLARCSSKSPGWERAAARRRLTAKFRQSFRGIDAAQPRDGEAHVRDP